MPYNKLNRLCSAVPEGAPLTAEDLRLFEISADLAVHYVRAGWLMRLERGVYCRAGSYPALEPSLRLLARKLDGLHIGGKSALHWRGMPEYLCSRPMLHLYGWQASRLPHWFTQRFRAEYHRNRLFEERPAAPRGVAPLEMNRSVPLVSVPERALLELLSQVGTRQPLQEARELVKGARDLRPDILCDLLKRCTSVKTVRLCLQLGRETLRPWAPQLDPTQLPTGSDRPWVSRSPEGLLVLPP
jgi:hypothetical protein